MSFIEPWFKEIAYGIILLRKEGYPCVFYGDYYGTGGDHAQPGFKEKIARLSKIRKNFVYGDQDDYFDSPSCSGWVRHGDENHPHKSAVILSSGDMDTKRMFVGEEEAGKVYADYTENNEGKVTIEDDGFGAFMVGAGSISVWVEDGVVL